MYIITPLKQSIDKHMHILQVLPYPLYPCPYIVHHVLLRYLQPQRDLSPQLDVKLFFHPVVNKL